MGFSIDEILGKGEGNNAQNVHIGDNYYYGNCPAQRKIDDTPSIDVSELSYDEKKDIHGKENITYCGQHNINGVLYDFGDDEDDEVSKVSKYDFLNNVSLIAEFGSYANYKKNIDIDSKTMNKSWWVKLFGLGHAVKSEVNKANKARQQLRELEETKLLDMTKPFIQNEAIRTKEVEENLKSSEKARESDVLAKGMKAMSEQMQGLKETVDSLSIPAQKMPTAKEIADELLSRFNKPLKASYSHARVIEAPTTQEANIIYANDVIKNKVRA